ncbi:MAG: exodeoxyribonuclease VII large subunit [Clostridia bacterium]|nr:exodeoxyribonuclease VII large subunit [Clostridia bacterium]
MQRDSVFSISQINEYIKMTLESNPVLGNVWLRGEISNFKSNYSSGHLYFSLKDERASIRAVMFRSSAARLKFRPESGMTVLVHGKISTYTVSGDYQIILDDMQPDGAGSLAIAFEQLKKKLEAEGLFDPARKKQIPPFVRSVGVITSASGAALHDIVNVSGRRCPSARLVIYPAYVQGELAPASLASGIRFFNDRHPVDLIIIGRGGGSAEDLWCFNDEALARTVAASRIPVISAVGHETDFTICDFVADMRAPTPSAAAEIAFPDTSELRQRIATLRARADSAISHKIYVLSTRLNMLRQGAELHSPERVLDENLARLARVCERMDTLADASLSRAENRFGMLCARLEGVNPLAVLAHGYAMVQNGDGAIVSSVEELRVGDRVRITLSDGCAEAEVLNLMKNISEDQ